MSHDATNWAIKQRGLKPATKIVLWHLADCHNPSHGCFPSHEYLAENAEMSISTVQRHIKELEALGLISRSKVKRKGKFDRTEYELHLHRSNQPAVKSATGQNEQEPPVNSDENHRSKLRTNLVMEPLSGTGNADAFGENFVEGFAGKIPPSKQRGSKAGSASGAMDRSIRSAAAMRRVYDEDVF